jgi:hypothetical protein
MTKCYGQLFEQRLFTLSCFEDLVMLRKAFSSVRTRRTPIPFVAQSSKSHVHQFAALHPGVAVEDQIPPLRMRSF